MKAMRKSDLFRSAFQKAPDGMLMIDRDGNCLEANRAASRLLGVSHSKLLTIGIHFLLQQVGRKIDWKKLLRHSDSVYELRLEDFRGQFRIIGHDRHGKNSGASRDAGKSGTAGR
jgi:PAS domain S-box-containing protein